MTSTGLITDKIPVFDLYLFLQELLYAETGKIPKVWIVSPWIKNLTYYVKASGLFTSIHWDSLGDQLTTLDFFRLYSKSKSPDIRIVTVAPSKTKYETRLDMLDELRFLVSAVNLGAKVYFYEHHKKYLLTNFGVVAGGTNYTQSGRYFKPEASFYFETKDPEYQQCCDDVQDVIKKSQSRGDETLPFLQETLRKFELDATGHGQR